MTRLRLPYIHEFQDRHGKTRRYFRGKDGKRKPLPGLPGSEEFMLAYQAALAGAEIVSPAIGTARTKPGTVNPAVVPYYNSAAFKNGLRTLPRQQRRAILERFRAEHGDKRLATLPTP